VAKQMSKTLALDCREVRGGDPGDRVDDDAKAARAQVGDWTALGMILPVR